MGVFIGEAVKPLSTPGRECRRPLEGEYPLHSGVGRGRRICVGGVEGKLRGIQNQREVRWTQNPGRLYLSRALVGFASQVSLKSPWPGCQPAVLSEVLGP